MGYFKIGDCIEVSGNLHSKVVYADENVFVCQKFHQSSGAGLFLTNELELYSNDFNFYESKYWIRKTELLKNFNTVKANPLYK